MKRTRQIRFELAPSKFREERTPVRRVRIGEAIVNGTLGESNSPLLLHGHYDAEDSVPEQVLANTGRYFDPFAQVVEPDPE